MDGHQIDNIAWFAPVGCSRCLIGGQIHGVQDVTEKLISLWGEKTKRAIVNPFQAHPVAKTFDFGFPLAGQNGFPCEFKSGFGQGLLIGNRGGIKPSLRILKDVDIRGKARTFADCSSVTGNAKSFDALRQAPPIHPAVRSQSFRNRQSIGAVRGLNGPHVPQRLGSVLCTGATVQVC